MSWKIPSEVPAGHQEGGDKTFIDEMGLDDSEGEGDLELEELDDSFRDPDYREEARDQVISSSDEDMEAEMLEGLFLSGGKGSRKGGKKGEKRKGQDRLGLLHVIFQIIRSYRHVFAVITSESYFFLMGLLCVIFQIIKSYRQVFAVVTSELYFFLMGLHHVIFQIIRSYRHVFAVATRESYFFLMGLLHVIFQITRSY